MIDEMKARTALREEGIVYAQLMLGAKEAMGRSLHHLERNDRAAESAELARALVLAIMAAAERLDRIGTEARWQAGRR